MSCHYCGVLHENASITRQFTATERTFRPNMYDLHVNNPGWEGSGRVENGSPRTALPCPRRSLLAGASLLPAIHDSRE
jgi:hypothetical protein